MKTLYCTLLLLLAHLAPGVEGGVEETARKATSFADCDALVWRHPDSHHAYSCYLRLAREQNRSPAATRRLEALLAVDPDNAMALFFLAALEADQGHDRAEALYRDAIERFAAAGDDAREAYSRIWLATFLLKRDRSEEAEAESEQAARLAEAVGHADLIAEVRVGQGWRSYRRADYGKALLFFKKAEQAVFPGGSFDARVQVLEGLGAAAWAMSRSGEALDYFLRTAEMLRQSGDLFREATARYNVALAARGALAPARYNQEQLRALTQQAVDTAVRAGNRRQEASSRRLLALYLEDAASIEQYERSLRIAREMKEPQQIREILRLMARRWILTRPDDPEPAFRLMNEAIESARAYGRPDDLAIGYAARSDLHWKTGSRERAIADALAGLEAAEQVRGLQADSQIRARTFSRYAHIYKGLASRLLDDATVPPSPDEVDLAFQVIERMRARSLLDELDAGGAGTEPASVGPRQQERALLLGQIAQVQQRLMQPDVPAEETERAMAELERLETEELALSNEAAGDDRVFAAKDETVVSSLDDLKPHLAEDQALLSFQVQAGHPEHHAEWGTSSWVVVVTREGTQAHRIPDAAVFEPNLDLFLGLLKRRDGSERSGAAWLHDRLLDDALRGLPPGVRRLVVVPDGPLHRLPFGALREDSGASPLAARYAITLAPSATVWLRCKTGVDEQAGLPLLALADPALPTSGKDALYRSANVFEELPGLGPLPRSRREGRELVRRLGRGSRLLEGPAASERSLKTTALGDFRILHLAAHAVVDHEQPQRSAVVLAPGTAGEDGLLQIREIVELDLSGRIVILSACSSAGGTVLQGEGVLGLARAFFQAGAHAVVGSLWPLKDDEAADLVGDFSRHLARGESLTEALAATRLEWIHAGRPAASWSGLVLLGDGDLVPFPDGTEPGRPRWPVVAGLTLAMLGLAALSRLSLRR